MEEAVSVSVLGIKLAGIVSAAVRNAVISSAQLRRVATQLEQHGHGETSLSVEVELFLRISNTDVLSSIQSTAFRVRADADGNNLRAVAASDMNWAMAWERGIEPIKQAALEGMRRDLWNMDGAMEEDSYSFQAGMVLLASELVGPYVDRVATFLGYSRRLVQGMGARLHEAKIWDGNEVRSDNWLDLEQGAMAFLLDMMVAEGKLIRRWSEARKQFAYRSAENGQVPRLAV